MINMILLAMGPFLPSMAMSPPHFIAMETSPSNGNGQPPSSNGNGPLPFDYITLHYITLRYHITQSNKIQYKVIQYNTI